MSDSSDALSKAVALNKKLAAGLLVRKEELEAEIARVQAAGGAFDALATDLASVQQQLAAAMAEIAELKKLAERRGVSASAIGLDEDPVAPSLEQAALQRARDGINELDAQAGLSPSTAASTPPPKPSREEAEEQARKEFEALRSQSPKTKRTM